MCVRTECRIKKIPLFCNTYSNEIGVWLRVWLLERCTWRVWSAIKSKRKFDATIGKYHFEILSFACSLPPSPGRPVARVNSLKKMCAHTALWLEIIWSESCIVWQRSAQQGIQWPSWSPTKWYLHLFNSLVFEIETFLVRFNKGLPSCLSRSNTMDFGHWVAGENDYRSTHGTVFTRRWSSLKYNCTYFFLAPHNHQTMANENYIYIQSRTCAIRRCELEE